MSKLPKTYVEGFHHKEAVSKMPYNQLGNTDIIISKLGLGGAAMSGFYDEFDDCEAIATVVEAVKCGINYIDTAPYYGEGRSETLLGKALKEIPRESYILSTKVGRYTTEWETMFNYSEEKITQGFEQSLKLLGVNYVDIVVVHDIEFADMREIYEVALPAVKKLVDCGKAKYIAVSGYPVSSLWDAVCNSKVNIDVILTYSRDTLIDGTFKEFIPKFKGKNIGVINAAPTALSMLTSVGPQKWHPADEKTKKICAEAVKYCKDNDVELGRLAVYHTLQTEYCHTVLVGINRRDILKSNLDIVRNGISQKEMEVLKYLNKNIFPKGENLHWEGIEVAVYKKHVKK